MTYIKRLEEKMDVINASHQELHNKVERTANNVSVCAGAEDDSSGSEEMKQNEREARDVKRQKISSLFSVGDEKEDLLLSKLVFRAKDDPQDFQMPVNKGPTQARQPSDSGASLSSSMMEDVSPEKEEPSQNVLSLRSK